MDFDFRRRFTWLLGLLLILSASFAFGQGIVAGSISGTLEDQQKARIAGAQVTAKNTGTNQEFKAASNDVGLFSLRSIPTGIYNVTIEAKNFRKLQVSSVLVTAAADSDLGILSMTIGAATEVVTVEGAAPLVESSTVQGGTTFDTQKLRDIPIGAFDEVAYFTPGVVTVGSNSFSNNNGAGLSVNGQRGRNNNFQIDGQSNNDNSVAGPSIFMGNEDLIAEFKIITNNPGVEYGRNSGSIINYVTKNGTNNFHGTAFEHYTGNWADSLTNTEKSSLFGFCAPGQTPAADGCDAISGPPRYVENRYGGTIGGPVVPNKIWFFGSYMEDRIRAAGGTSSSGSTVTPTPAGLATLNAAFPGNPAVNILNEIGPFAVGLGNPRVGNTSTETITVGTTSVPVEFGTVLRNVPSTFDDYEASGRADFQITDKDRLFARYFFQQNNLTGATGRFAGGAWVDIPARDQQIALDWTRTWTNHFVNQVRFSYSRAGFGFQSGSFPSCTNFSINQCPTNIQFGATYLSFGIQNNLPQGRLVNVTQLQDNASLVRGHHTFKFGGEYARQRSPNVFLPNINGGYNYGSSFDDFMNNRVPSSAFSLTDGPPNFPFKEQDASLYFGDDWRIRDNLTLNLGVRWEYWQQAVNLLSDLSTATQTGPNPFWDTSLPLSVTTLPKIPNDFNNIGPSFGFAWTPRIWKGIFGEDKTVIRGGYRVSFDPAYYNIFLNMATAAPVVNAGTISVCTGSCLPLTGPTGADVRAAHLIDIPRGVNPGTRLNTRVTDDFHSPYVQIWSLGIQREISSKIAAEVRYVGSHTVGEFQTFNANPALAGLIDNGFSSFIPSNVTECTTAGAPGLSGNRQDCNFRNVRARGNTSWSMYQGLQSELRVRGWHGLTAALSYTYSKTMDNVSEIFSTGTGATTVAGAQNPYDINIGERSESGLSFPHVASLYWSYELPFQKSQQGMMGRLFGGWVLAGTYRYTSGQLYTPAITPGNNTSCQTSFDGNFFGISTCRAFAGNPIAPVDTVGFFCDGTASSADGNRTCLAPNLITPLPFGTMINFYDPCIGTLGSLTPCAVSQFVSTSDVRWIFNDDTAAAIFGTPYGNTRRNPSGVRGQNISTINFSLVKNTKVSEKVTLRLDAQVFNLFNHQFRGVPDPFIEDGHFATGGSFANNFFNDNGGDYDNATLSGIGRRRILLGAKIIF